MGRSGRGSGGGSRSSGSRSVGSRSSGGRSSSSRSGYSSSRSSHSSSHSSYHRPSYHSCGYSGPRISYSHIYFGNGDNKGFLIAFCVIFILFFLTIFTFGQSGNITASTVEREPLTKGTVIETEYYTDELGWIDSVSKLESGMQHFYQKTGVQPYIYITDTIPSGLDINSYANSLYEDLFNDEAHYLLLFYERNDEYKMQWVCGAQAKTVIDQEASDIILDYIEKYYYSDMSESEFFSKAFSDAADRIMTKTTPTIVYIVGFISAVLIIGIAFVWWNKKKEQKNKEAEYTKEILNTPIDKIDTNPLKDLEDKYQ